MPLFIHDCTRQIYARLAILTRRDFAGCIQLFLFQFFDVFRGFIAEGKNQ